MAVVVRKVMMPVWRVGRRVDGRCDDFSICPKDLSDFVVYRALRLSTNSIV